VVAAAADTFTSRVSVRTPTDQREFVARALREEIVRRLRALDVFVAAPVVAVAPGPGAAATPPPPADS
jgi:hypothetical protein